MPPEAVLHELEASALRGRGGAGFQMGKKVSFLPKGGMDKYLVCNADESEPGTFKDRELMQKSPHMLLEGIVIAAHAAGATRSFIYIRGEYVLQADILDAALAEARAAGFVGEQILGSDTSLSLVVHRGAGAYICGEETGLLDSLEGKRGNPRLKPPFPANQGLYQGPTLINNVETLCTVPTILRMGGDEYAKLGVDTSTGTKLVSVSGHVQRPGNYEIELGIPSREIIYGLAGGPAEGRKVKCWFPGGSSSPVLTGDDLDIPYDFDSMAKAGTMLGSGAIIVVDDSTPILDVALKVAKFYRHESCGKCTPCREGTNWTVTMLERIDAGEATPMDLEIMASVQEHIIGNCLCVLGDAMAMPIGSMIAKFNDELEAHMATARLRGGVGDIAAAEGVLAAQGASSAPAGATGRPTDAARPRPPHARPPSADAAPNEDDHLHDRRPRGAGARELDAGRRRQARRHRDPRLLLRAQARQPRRRLPHVPGGDRGHPQAADRLLHARQGRHGRAHPVRARQDRAELGGRVPADQPPARLPRLRQGRRVPAAGHHLRLGPRHLALHRAQAPLRQAARALPADCDRPRALHPLLPLRALLPGDLRGLPARAAGARRRTPTSPPSTATPTSRPSPATSSSCAPSARSPRSPTASARARGTSRTPARSARCALRSATSRSPCATSACCACSPARTPRSTTAGCATAAASPTPLLGGDERVTAPLVRDGGELRPVSWERALEEAAAGLRRAGERVGALAGGGATNEEGLLLARLVREVLGSPHLDSRAAGALPLELLRALAEPGLQATVSDLEFAHAVLLLDCEPDRRRRDPRPAPAQGRAPPRAAAGARRAGAAARGVRARGAARHAARRRRGGRRAVARAPGRRRRRRAGRAGAARARRHAGARRDRRRRAARSPRPRQRPRPARGRRAPQRRAGARRARARRGSTRTGSPPRWPPAS